MILYVGDEDGTLKLWDLRDKDSQPIFALKEVDDYISAILTNTAKKILLTTSGDGFLTAINIGARFETHIAGRIMKW